MDRAESIKIKNPLYMEAAGYNYLNGAERYNVPLQRSIRWVQIAAVKIVKNDG